MIMKFIRKIKTSLLIVLLPVLLLVFINSSLNRHIHKLSSGQLVSHAHPVFYKDQAGTTDSSHQHTKKELFIFELFSNILFLLTGLLLIGIIAFPGLNTELLFYNKARPVKEYYYLLNYHAPPVIG